MGTIGPERLARLYDEHAPALVLYARQWSLTPEDIVQNAFLKLARQWMLPRKIVPWLYRVVRNEAIATARSTHRRTRREAHVSHPEACFSTTDDRIDAQHATRLLDEIPAESREVIVARVWGGLTFDEIARLQGCSLTTAHRRYQSGMAQLQERLEPSWTIQTTTPKTT